MICISAYLMQDYVCLKCEDKPIWINSAGYYHFKTKDVGANIRLHGREDYQIIYIAKGKGYFKLKEREEVIEEGHLVLYKPYEMQYYRYDYKDQSEIYWIHFTGSEVEKYFANIGRKGVNVYKVGFDKAYVSTWGNIMTEIQIKRPYYEQILESQMIFLLALFSRAITEERQSISNTHKVVQKVIEQMHRNHNEFVEVRAYAERCNMSVCWFIKNFKEITGMTPNQYMNHIKINEAKALLSNTGLNINEVADLLGFQNAFYFSKLFKKLTGKCPREWKNEK